MGLDPRARWHHPEAVTPSGCIRELEHCDEDAKIVFSNDGGYTYGYITEGAINTQTVESKEEEELRENMESLRNELEELDYDYETQYDRDISEEEYNKERANLFELYNITEEQYKNYKF